MGRLIDADELLTAFPVDDEPMLTKSCVYMTIRRMPTVDAVPVVRCKDCKSFSHGYCQFHDAKFVRPNGYCYWGERKDGDNG